MSVCLYTDARSTSPGSGIRIARVAANWGPRSFVRMFIMVRVIRMTSMTSMTRMLHMMTVIVMFSAKPRLVTVTMVGFVLVCPQVAKKLRVSFLAQVVHCCHNRSSETDHAWHDCSSPTVGEAAECEQSEYNC